MDSKMVALMRWVQDAERKLDFAVANWRKEPKDLKSEAHRLSKNIRNEQIRLRRNLLTHIGSIGILYWLTAPVIYSLIIPIVLTDVFSTVFQYVCFPVYGVSRVRRGDYVVIDRHRLPYLNALEKLNCVYCGYANGVIAYVREVASRTEQFFCPIKHALAIPGPHKRYANFVEYGEAEEYRARKDTLSKTAGDDN